MICNCLLEDPGCLARAVGKQLRLWGSEAPCPTSLKSEADDQPRDNGRASTALWLGGKPEFGIHADDGSGTTPRAIAGDGDHRRPDDAYYTPQGAVESLLKVEEFEGLIWEPAEGDGRIVVAFTEWGAK
jgi:hypothetical protein